MRDNLKENESKRNLVDYVWVGVRGFAMGAADVVPGVSGGTMAFILGIYDELIEAIHAVNGQFLLRLFTLRWRAAFEAFPWKFLLSLALGILTAILTLASVLHWALENHPLYIWAFFFGLILASVIVVRRRVRRWDTVNLAAAAVAAGGAFLLVGLTPAETPHTPLLLFLSGAVAICAMILPGISGAFILVLLGKYSYVLAAVKHFDLLTIALVGLGAVSGLLMFVRLLRWMLHRNHDLVVAVLTGFMAGSLRKVWPWKTVESVGGVIVREENFIPLMFGGEEILAVALMILGMSIVLLVEYFAARRNTLVVG